MKKNIKQKILYGAGAMGKRAFNYYTRDNADMVYCFADTYKGGTEYLGKSVVSFEEFSKIHSNYDVVLCIFNLFETATLFEKSGIDNYVVWDDNITLPLEARLADDYFNRLRHIEPLNELPKIIYGAGQFGEYALHFYGEDKVSAFADRSKSGTSYLDKPVLAPDQLIEMENIHDIVICVNQSANASESLRSAGVKNFRIWSVCDDVRMEDVNDINGTLFDTKIINELKQLDFIANPEYINDYHGLYLQHERLFMNPNKLKRSTIFRNLDENRPYGYYNEMANYAGKNAKYYEGPSVCHTIWLDRNPVLSLETQNTIEAGCRMKPIIHSTNRDCLCFICGPYLHYAEPFYDDAAFTKYKKQMGHNLLVFPVHSVPYSEKRFDYRSFVEFSVSEAKRFDSITVCVHYNDFNNDMTHLFRAHGANIVSCGLKYDPFFVRRLKTIVSTADAVLTNGVGSHITHFLGMNKPLKYFSQQIEFFSIVEPKSVGSIYSDNTPLQTTLPTNEYLITKELLDAYNDFCTFSQVKTKEEMGAIFDLSKRIMESCDYKRSKYTESLRKTYRELQSANTKEEKLQLRLMRDALPPDYQC